MVYLGLGDKDRTFEWLNKACDQRDWTITTSLKPDMIWDLLRRFGYPL